MSGDRVPKGASSAAPRLPSQPPPPSSPQLHAPPRQQQRQLQQRLDPADDLAQGFAAASVSLAEPPPSPATPRRQPMASLRNFASTAAAASASVPATPPRFLPQTHESDDEPGLQEEEDPERELLNRMRRSAVSTHSHGRDSFDLETGNAASYPTYNNSNNITSHLWGRDSEEPTSPLAFDNPFERENLEVPGADSTHRSGSSTCALRCGQSILASTTTNSKTADADDSGDASAPPTPVKNSSQANLPSPTVFSLTANGGLSTFEGSTFSLTTTPPPEHNWQATKCSIRERNAVLLNNEFMADIYFVIGQDNKIRVPAHKYVLSIGSSVFYAMFFGGLASNSEEIEIPDVEPVAFMVLLKYLYCDEIDLEPDTVLAVLYAAKKYIVPHLARSCVRFLETSLSAKNACVLLSQSRLFEEPELMQRCWEVIDAQAEEALVSDGFADIDYETLKSVLARETLNAQEKVIFDSACRWAEAECGRRELESTPENLRKVLSDALLLLRIPAMTLEEFANGAAQSGILTLEETNEIFLYYTAQKKPDLTFPVVKRQGLSPLCCHRFQSSAYRSNQWRYRGRCDAIQFAVDRRIFIAGFGLYGSSNGAAEYMVRIELKRNGTLVGERDTNFKSDGSSSTFPVWFCNPIQIEAETYYTACVILDGAELSYFGQEGMSEVAINRITFQFQCSSDSTNGTGVQGGQIPELIFFA